MKYITGKNSCLLRRAVLLHLRVIYFRMKASPHMAQVFAGRSKLNLGVSVGCSDDDSAI